MPSKISTINGLHILYSPFSSSALSGYMIEGLLAMYRPVFAALWYTELFSDIVNFILFASYIIVS